tara:strand:+ start:73 stop:249 length:177 start_codon:yes stop_codon:yes gene_type:complete
MIESKGEVYHVYCERECVMNNLPKEKFESVWEFCKELQDSRFSYERCDTIKTLEEESY